MGLGIRYGAASDVGQVRSVNQDSWLASPDAGLYVVADGMGGHQGGEVASSIAVEVISERYRSPGQRPLLDAIQHANVEIHERGAVEPDLRGMGTTAVVAVLLDPADTDDAGTATATSTDVTAVDVTAVDPDDGDAPRAGAGGAQLVIANVGDSRAYLYRDGELIQLTDDHSMVADLVREGRISEEEAETHPQRNILTRVLGVYDEIEVDLFPVDPARGDRYLLCSDGLFNEVSEERIAGVLRRLDDPADAADELVRLANEGGGRDNITVVLLDVVDDGGAAATASAAVGGSAAAGHGSGRTDLAGFSSAGTGDPDASDTASAEGATGTDASGAVSARGRSRRRSASQRWADATARTRFTWRVGLFVLLLLVVVGGAFLTIQWYGTSTYFVAFDDDRVAIFKGRPGGLLWIDPELEERTTIERAVVAPRYRQDLDAGREYASLADARRYVENVENDALDPDRIITVTTSTTEPRTTTTTTTAGAAGTPNTDDAGG